MISGRPSLLPNSVETRETWQFLAQAIFVSSHRSAERRYRWLWPPSLRLIETAPDAPWTLMCAVGPP
jgi:hypothetical protein